MVLVETPNRKSKKFFEICTLLIVQYGASYTRLGFVHINHEQLCVLNRSEFNCSKSLSLHTVWWSPSSHSSSTHFNYGGVHLLLRTLQRPHFSLTQSSSSSHGTRSHTGIGGGWQHKSGCGFSWEASAVSFYKPPWDMR